MEVNISLPKTKILKEVVEVRQYRNRPLRDLMGFINEEVHLLRNPLTADPKYPHFTWNQEINRAWLEGVTRQMDLLCIVEAMQ